MALSPISTVSYSGLGAADKCLKLFELQYIEKIVPYVPSLPMEIGTVMHSSLELVYQGVYETAFEAFELHAWPDYLEEHKLGFLAESLEAIGLAMDDLNNKSKPDYFGPGAIVTKSGAVSKSPKSTQTWKDSIKDLDLGTLDSQASAVDTKFVNIPLTKIYLDVRELAFNYSHPSWYGSTDPGMIEIGFSAPPKRDKFGELLNIVYWPNLPGVKMKGYIDMVCRDKAGKLVVLDHKTSQGEAPTETMVQHNSQLNLYAYVWKVLTGEWPDYLAINHIRTGKAIRAEFIPEIALENVRQKEALLKLIIAGHFYKRNPTDFQTPCTKCPMLSKCWPRYNLIY